MANHSITLSSQPVGARPSLLCAVLLLLGLLSAAPAYSLTVVPRSFDELVQLADVVMVGTVQDVRSEFADNDPDQNILSFVSFKELQIIKGEVPTQEYTLQVPGGVVGRFAQNYPGIPQFQPGQRYVVFIRGNHRDFFPVVGVTQGVFQVLTDGQGRQVVVRDDIALQAGLTRLLSSITHNAPSLDTFLRQIKALLPAAEGSP